MYKTKPRLILDIELSCDYEEWYYLEEDLLFCDIVVPKNLFYTTSKTYYGVIYDYLKSNRSIPPVLKIWYYYKAMKCSKVKFFKRVWNTIKVLSWLV